MLCHRGCGLPATYTNYKDLPCCNKSASRCPETKKKIGNKNAIALKGKTLTNEHKRAIGAGITGRKLSKESIEKIRQSNIETKKNQEIIPWNKGLTKADPRVAKYAKSQTGQKRKNESLEILSRSDPVYSNFKKYRNRVAVRTKKTYDQFKGAINPDNLFIGKCGVDGAHQIDHIISVREGFERELSIEYISSKENLQILPWLDNVQKYDGKGLRKNSKGKK